MSSFFHAINICTLAGWLSVVGFGTAGVLLPAWRNGVAKPAERETEVFNQDFTIGDGGQDEKTEIPQSAESAPSEAPAEEPAAPPELPELAEPEALPEVPDLPEPKPEPSVKPKPAEPAKPKTKPSTNSFNKPTSEPRRSSAQTGGSGKPSTGGSTTGKPGGTGQKSGGSNSSGDAGMSNSARLAAGRIPTPSYPSEARRQNQTGTVMVTFTIGENGRVISAYASKPCSYPLLNNAAVSAVKRAKFPPGKVFTPPPKPIVFRLR